MITNFRLYEMFNQLIPDELAIWCMDFYAQQTMKFIDDVNLIPSYLFQETYDLIKKETKTTLIYRCESRDYEITKPIRFSPKNNAGISWTYDKNIAMGFIEPDSDDLYSYLYTLDINDIKYPLSLDLVINKITDEQIKMVTNPMTKDVMTNYQSEKEILVFDTFYSDILKIEIIS